MKARDSSRDPAGRDEVLAGLAEIRLLTVDGADFRRVGVEASDGMVTLSGEVKTPSEREQAAAVVRKLEGVSAVDNQLQVTREESGRSPAGANWGYRGDPYAQNLENASSNLIPNAKGIQ